MAMPVLYLDDNRVSSAVSIWKQSCLRVREGEDIQRRRVSSL
jgi:hypothetical protein